ncbi:PspC domain-containing protein [Desertivirga brevis]|uniref:PspC domain-containing protein n=1 Tax=Desertivirga brevis TaxID=2810310 RepID=UPI001A956A13|nr:PspC domain-containing protein [Pedobacter sp. SYSU D00873]
MEKKLERDESNKMLAGVAAGLADYLNVEITWIRVLFICLTIFGFSGVWIYIILWIAVPARAITYGKTTSRESDYRIYEGPDLASSYTSPVSINKKERDNSVRYVTGMILIALGSYFLLDEFFTLPDWISLEKLWPLVFVAIGLVILVKPSKNKDLPKKETPFENNETSSTGESL